MSITDWKMQEEWKNEMEQKELEEQDKFRRIQKEPYFQKIKNTLTPLAELKERLNRKYEEALAMINSKLVLHSLSNKEVIITDSDLSSYNISVSDEVLIAKIQSAGYAVKLEINGALKISGW